jgi:broad specificity phosphatase PhoE
VKFKPLIYGLLALAIPGATFAEPLHVGNSTALKNAVILVIRHAEQSDDGDGLSSAGEARAKAYVNYFKNFTIDGQPLKLDYLFAAADSRSSRRPRLTIEPTAKELGLTIDTRFKNQQFLELVDEIQSLPHSTNVLICWHHGKIPQLLRALGADPKRLLPDGRWPGDVFDSLIELRYDRNGNLFESRRIDERFSSNDSVKHAQAALW